MGDLNVNIGDIFVVEKAIRREEIGRLTVVSFGPVWIELSLGAVSYRINRAVEPLRFGGMPLWRSTEDEPCFGLVAYPAVAYDTLVEQRAAYGELLELLLEVRTEIDATRYPPAKLYRDASALLRVVLRSLRGAPSLLTPEVATALRELIDAGADWVMDRDNLECSRGEQMVVVPSRREGAQASCRARVHGEPAVSVGTFTIEENADAKP